MKYDIFIEDYDEKQKHWTSRQYNNDYEITVRINNKETSLDEIIKEWMEQK